ncbi:D-arabinono-1,4-lactone oxidase [Streptoalloteichus hindustanus]|uniref:L-gulonolactone oxidase n=1 Tax=Streptoalloteichus hindustanus TaxID=2017 RepID=A0A1M4V7H1_STRHI|nr:D-arabinono-1,4-lactone oxidase [Streptoalloteichus hindustanus]SHE64837.1 L-gulonolactone oxidase [Streptoalloteichus hindustanus]
MSPPAPTWWNWARTAAARPARFVRPRDLGEIVDAVRGAADEGRTVRPLGSGHSFSEAAATNDVALDLREWSGVLAVDGDLVTVRAGTRLRELNAALDRIGLAMANLGDIDEQTVAGAISTGTHGTGARLGGLATQVAALELVLADGSVARCSERERPDLFHAARISLGALGVISSVTLRCVPRYALAADERPMPLPEVLDRFTELADGNDHFEFYFFAHGDTTLVKRNNRLPADERPRPLHPVRHFLEYQVVENTALDVVCRLGRAVPALVRPLNRVCGALLSPRRYSDRSHRVFVTRRQVRFVETEWAVPRESIHEVIKDLRAAVPRLEHPVIMPIEVRVAAPDDIWLSTAHRRDTAYLAAHQFVGMPYRHWFATVADVCGAVGGRPHWGKMHDLTAADLRERYPRFDDFLALRRQLDPAGVFRGGYTDRVLGPAA